MRGLGRVTDVLSQALFPVAAEAAQGLDPRTVKAMQRQGLMQLGLGMMAAKEQGAGLGQGLNLAFNQAQQDINQGLGQALISRRANREDERLEMYDRRLRNAELQQGADAQQERINRMRGEARYKEGIARDDLARAEDKRRYEERMALEKARMAPGQQEPPSGYRWGADGNLEPIKGGPADPLGPQIRKGSQPLRKEFRQLPTVKAYEEVLPLLESAKKAPDTGYGDLQLIYTVGKTLDPGSVVREGELALTIAAGSPLQRILGTTRFSLEKGGRLPPKSRQQIMEMLNERVGSYKQAYDRDFGQYTQYANELGMDPELIVGKHADSSFGGKPKATRISNEDEYNKLPSGAQYIAPDGKMRVKQ